MARQACVDLRELQDEPVARHLNADCFAAQTGTRDGKRRILYAVLASLRRRNSRTPKGEQSTEVCSPFHGSIALVIRSP